MAAWAQLGNVSPGRLVDARLEIHHACQLVGIAAARSLLPARDDDSHTALLWLDIPGQWVTGEVPETSGLQAGLRPADLVLTLGGKDDPAGSQLDLVGKTLEQGLDWLRKQLAEHGVVGDRVVLEPHYEMPAHPVAEGASFSEDLAEERQELANYYATASILLADIAREHEGAAPILTWPHHFDIATLLPMGEATDGQQRTLGVGLSPGDESYAEPYLYVAPWPFPEDAEPPALPSGHWHAGSGRFAVLTATELLEGDDAEARAREFVAAALAAGRDLLSA